MRAGKWNGRRVGMGVSWPYSGVVEGHSTAQFLTAHACLPYYSLATLYFVWILFLEDFQFITLIK